MLSKYKGKYRTESARLKGWNYSWNGLYFITICTKHFHPFFGEIKNGDMFSSQIGQIAKGFWFDIPNHFADVELDEFVVMPNHVHGILFMPETDSARMPRVTDGDKNLYMSQLSPKKGSLSSIIRSYKGAVTREANLLNLEVQFGWHARFHDSIIRDADGLYAIRQYIRSNPRNWDKDSINPVNSPKF